MFEPQHSSLLQRYADMFGLPNQTADHAREWTLKLAEQFNFSFPTEGWGTKKAGETNPPSTDVICRPEAPIRLVGYDVAINAGAPSAVLNLHPEPMDISNQVFIEVKPVNHIGEITHDTMLQFSLFWAWRGMLERIDQLNHNLKLALNSGAKSIRWFFTVGDDGTVGQDPWSGSGAFYNHSKHLITCINLMRHLKSVELKSHMVLCGGLKPDGTVGSMYDTQAKRDAIVDRAASLINEFPDDFVVVEIWNEYRVNGAERAWLREMARRLRSQIPSSVRITLSTPDSVMGDTSSTEVSNEIEAMYGGNSGANTFTMHSTRPNHLPWNPETIRSLMAMEIIDGEPRGPGASGNPGMDWTDPNMIGGDFKTAIRGRAIIYDFHTMPGVWGGHCDPRWNDQNEWANFDDIPNWNEISQTIRSIAETGSAEPLPTPTPVPTKNHLGRGERLQVGERLISANNNFYLEYQVDGNLVIYEVENGPIWASQSAGIKPGYCEMQVDGNFVMYDANTTPVRATGTSGHHGATLQLNEDGNLVVYHAGIPLWASMSSPMEG